MIVNTCPLHQFREFVAQRLHTAPFGWAHVDTRSRLVTTICATVLGRRRDGRRHRWSSSQALYEPPSPQVER